MSSENAPKKIVQSLIELVNMAKRLMDETQQPFVTQELGKLFPSIRGRGRRGENSELLRIGTAESFTSATDSNDSSFATRSTTKRTIEEIWESKATTKNSLKPISHKTTSGKTPINFAILSRVKPNDFRFVTWFTLFLKFDLPRP